MEDREGALLLIPSDRADEKRTGEGHLPTVRRATKKTVRTCIYLG